MIKKNYTIILDDFSRSEAFQHLDSYDVIAYDTETTGLNVRKDRVIGFSFSGREGVAYYYPLSSWNGEKLIPIEENVKNQKTFLNILKNKKLIMWNGSFDIRITKNDLGVDLLDSLYIEGMLLKHTLDEEKPFGLKSVGVNIQNYIGFNVEDVANEEQLALKENIKSKGGSTTKNNFEMYKADLNILGKYAASDADLTLRITNYYLRKLEEEGLQKFFFEDEVMPLYKEVTIPMEEHGVKLDMNLLTTSKNEIEQDLERLEKEIVTELFSTDAAKKWYKNVVRAKTKISNKGSFAQELCSIYKPMLPISAKTGKYTLSKKSIESLELGPLKKFLELGYDGDLDYFVVFRCLENIYLRGNENKKVNISSKKQMGEIVFDYMNIPPLSRTTKGAPQFDDNMIDKLGKDGHNWAKLLHDYNKLIKIKGTYIDRFLDNHEDGYYYFSYKQHGTISGRYGSDAQQLPRPMEKGQESDLVLKYNNRIRAFFISEEGRVFIDSDYVSLEPTTFSHVCDDDGLKDIFRMGKDFYSTIAIDTEGLYEYSADKKADNYLGKLNKSKRQSAKSYSLGVPYGMSGYALGKALEISTEEAEELVNKYLNAYPKLKEWMELSKKMAQEKGYVMSEAGRIRHLPKVKKIYKIYGDKLLDYKFRNKLKNRLSDKEITDLYLDYKNGINNSRNYQIQSMAGSIVNRAAIAVTRKFKELGIDGWCCAQIHDQLIFNIPKNMAEKCKELIQDLMENTTKLSLKLNAPPELAVNWRDGH